MTESLRDDFLRRMQELELSGNINRLRDDRGREVRAEDVQSASSVRFGFDLKEAIRTGIIGEAMNVFEKGNQLQSSVDLVNLDCSAAIMRAFNLICNIGNPSNDRAHDPVESIDEIDEIIDEIRSTCNWGGITRREYLTSIVDFLEIYNRTLRLITQYRRRKRPNYIKILTTIGIVVSLTYYFLFATGVQLKTGKTYVSFGTMGIDEDPNTLFLVREPHIKNTINTPEECDQYWEKLKEVAGEFAPLESCFYGTAFPRACLEEGNIERGFYTLHPLGEACLMRLENKIVRYRRRTGELVSATTASLSSMRTLRGAFTETMGTTLRKYLAQNHFSRWGQHIDSIITENEANGQSAEVFITMREMLSNIESIFTTRRVTAEEANSEALISYNPRWGDYFRDTGNVLGPQGYLGRLTMLTAWDYLAQFGESPYALMVVAIDLGDLDFFRNCLSYFVWRKERRRKSIGNQMHNILVLNMGALPGARDINSLTRESPLSMRENALDRVRAKAIETLNFIHFRTLDYFRKAR